MAITERSVKNKRNSSGELTGRAGTVYDVNINYKSEGKSKTYSRKGFPTRKEAVQHEADMKAKLTNPSYVPPSAEQRKLTVRKYMTECCQSSSKHSCQLPKPYEKPYLPLCWGHLSQPAIPGHAG